MGRLVQRAERPYRFTLTAKEKRIQDFGKQFWMCHLLSISLTRFNYRADHAGKLLVWAAFRSVFDSELAVFELQYVSLPPWRTSC